jgi:hypothetical protein
MVPVVNHILDMHMLFSIQICFIPSRGWMFYSYMADVSGKRMRVLILANILYIKRKRIMYIKKER